MNIPKAVFNPGKPAVTKVLEEATEPTITLILTPREATVVLGLLGITHGNDGWLPYMALSALASRGDIGTPNYPLNSKFGGLNTDTDL